MMFRIDAMKTLAVLAAIFAAACSSTSGSNGKIPAPELQLEQAVGPAELDYPSAPIDVKYQVRVVNHAAVPITLKRINLRTFNPPGGAYTLTQPLVHSFNIVIPPSGEKTFDLWAHAQGYGSSIRDREPVTVKGFAYFESPQGYYNLAINQDLQQ